MQAGNLHQRLHVYEQLGLRLGWRHQGINVYGAHPSRKDEPLSILQSTGFQRRICCKCCIEVLTDMRNGRGTMEQAQS